MTLVKQDSGGFWVSGPLAVVLLGGMLAAMGYVYQFQDGRLWTDHEDIVQLKGTVSNDAAQTNRLESVLTNQGQTLTSMLSAIQAMKDTNDALKEQVHDLQKQVSDLDSMLRPIQHPSEH